MSISCWTILGIEPTEDPRTIKRAYARLLRENHPEDNPEGFQQVNQAYQQALKYRANEVEWEYEPELPEIPNDENASPVMTFEPPIEEHSELPAPEHDASETNSADKQSVALNSEQEQTTAFEPDPLEIYLNELWQQFQTIMHDQHSRRSAQEWNPFFHDERLQAFQINQLLGLNTFQALIHFYSSQREANQPFDIPQDIIDRFAEVFAWRERELEFTQRFDNQDIEALFAFAFGNYALSDEKNLPRLEEQGKKKRFGRNIAIFASWILVLFVLFRIFDFLSENSRQAAQKKAEQEAVVEVVWESDLLLCNDVFDASETPEFNRCLELAEEGWEEAQRRIAWAYTRDGEYQDWSEAYQYILELSYEDYYMDLLADIVLFLLGESESTQIKGERAIRAKANVRFPAAEGYLASIYGLKLNLLERDANIFWLLKSAFEKSEIVDVYEMTQVYANGIQTRINLDKARAVLEDYAQSDSPFSIEGAAWYLATLANNRLHPPEVAVQMAQTLVDYEDEQELFSFYDTLAAAYAANQQFVEAISTQEQAIALIDKSYLSAVGAEQERENYTERLESYQQQQAVYYADLEISDEAFFDDLKSDIESMLIDLLNVNVEAPENYVSPSSEATE